MLTFIENALVYAPVPKGRQSILLLDGRIGVVGPVDRRAVETLGVEYEVLDATDCLAVPGFIDPHEHLLGGSGEQGFASQTPAIELSELVPYGITTVVGCLGVDTTMKTLAGLLAKVKGLTEEGMSAYMWTGGYNVPPSTILDSPREDVMFIQEILGCGEVAISDERATDPEPRELARLVSDVHAGGMLSRKAGLTHFHVGDGPRRMQCLRDILNERLFQIRPEWLYATHITRSEELMREAIDLAAHGVTVDIDTVEEDLARWLRFYLDHGGDPARLTVSSDAGSSAPRLLYEQICKAVVEHKLPFERVLPLVTENSARTLKLEGKGTLEPGKDADVVLLHRGSLDVVDVFAKGRRMVRDGAPVVRERFLEDSNRRVTLHGEKD